MTVDKFGRHIGQKRANKIYLIEDTQKFRKELQQQWVEEFEKFKNLVSTHMNGLPAAISSKFSQDMRCPIFHPFVGVVNKSNMDYYAIVFDEDNFIEILMDCKVVYGACSQAVDIRITYPDGTERSMKIQDIVGEVIPKGGKIFFKRDASHNETIHGLFVYEVAPWHKDESPFK